MPYVKTEIHFPRPIIFGIQVSFWGVYNLKKGHPLMTNKIGEKLKTFLAPALFGCLFCWG